MLPSFCRRLLIWKDPILRQGPGLGYFLSCFPFITFKLGRLSVMSPGGLTEEGLYRELSTQDGAIFRELTSNKQIFEHKPR